ncbi:hypothetical protein V501_02887 [Pseudogymnoascus sp. VKM F-4519 (FW-2642)]|nr:hypothetical protein V501_02887 [Pseudogymnoascus sp. VKM F-4519 (FW-2642)]
MQPSAAASASAFVDAICDNTATGRRVDPCIYTWGGAALEDRKPCLNRLKRTLSQPAPESSTSSALRWQPPSLITRHILLIAALLHWGSDISTIFSTIYRQLTARFEAPAENYFGSKG